jgi:hypothetical protein
MKTFKELFSFLQSSTYTHVKEWLSSEEKWKGVEKQESLFRILAHLGTVRKINEFHMCIGNFNLQTIRPVSNHFDFFFTPPHHKERCLKDKGDSSDLTGIHKSNPKHLLVCTSKCIRHLSLKKLDIDSIATNFKPYEDDGYTMTLCIVVKDAQEFNSTKTRAEQTSAELKKWIENHNTIVIDWNDLNEAYHMFQNIVGKTCFQDFVKADRSPLVLRLHQRLCCLRTLRWKGITYKILWGHIPRSGKSFMMGGVILEDSQGKSKCNYLVITTAPKETMAQYLEMLGCSPFRDFHVVHLDGKSKKPLLQDKNIILCSKQFLQSKLEEKTRSIPWLKKMEFDIRFVDESHHGGTTELAQKTLDYYGHGSFTIYMTATYSKPAREYNIPREHWILWDMEDIQLCKRIDEKKSVERLVEKHGNDFRSILSQYSTENIKADFSKYPDLEILSWKIHPDTLPEILKETRDNLYGWSTDSCFLLQQAVHEGEIVQVPKFQNREEHLKLWYTIFGKRDSFGIPDKEYPDDLVVYKRIEKICKTASSRFFGEDVQPYVVLAFLPPHHIDLVSQATKQLLEEKKVVSHLDILCIHSKTTTDPKQAILDAQKRADHRGKKGVLVLSARQCSMAATIHGCQLVLLLNSSSSYDQNFQMMYRAMTEGEGKKRGFVYDPNIHRVVNTLVEYGTMVQPESHPKDAVMYLFQERLMNLNSDHWEPCFGHGPSPLTTLTDSLYEVYSSRMSGALENLFRRMSLKQDLFSKNDYEMMKCMFDNLPLSKQSRKQLWEDVEQIQKGIEKTLVVSTKPTEPADKEKEKTRVDPVDLLRPLSIVISLLTIHDKEKTTLEEMFALVEKNHHYQSILLNQVRVWWGKEISSENMNLLLRIFQKYLEKDAETSRMIRLVKELFCQNIRNAKELSKIIDKYLIPQENEKKENAEVSTPYGLRQDMLDAIPDVFWTKKTRVLEPCCGKGGFLMDIVDRFMTGLKKKYPDEKTRYKEIVENCLYFSDINDMNIFICRLLLDPYKEYKVHYHEGDTLQLDIKEKWGLDGFDAVIGNPPYNSSGHTATGNTIWQCFVRKALEDWTRKGPGRYIVLVHPSGWRKPNTEKGKFTGLYPTMATENYMRRLSIHGVKEGMKTFRCGTRYDWYVMERVESHGRKTRVRDEKGDEVEEIMGEWEWFPNHSYSQVKKLLAREGEERCPILYSRNAYGADKKEWMSKVEDEKHPYPCVHSTPQHGVRYMYSSLNNKGMFGTPKIIFGESGIGHVVEDMEGVYGITHGAMGIQVSDPHELTQMKNVLLHHEFRKIIDACMYSSFRIDWNMFKHFKRDFWKHLI